LLHIQGFVHEIAFDLKCADGRQLPVLVNIAQKRDTGGQPVVNRITVFNATDRRKYERELLLARRRAEEVTEEIRRLNETLEERVALEVSERMKAEEALRQAQKMEAVGQLTGGIAHDFNNLLQGITGALERAQRRIETGRTPEAERYIKMAVDSASRAAALTHRLLAFSRRQTLDPRPTDINRLIAGMEELIR
jgi:C4-dicarboxylate-specific signal transduction histidine kinase